MKLIDVTEEELGDPILQHLIQSTREMLADRGAVVEDDKLVVRKRGEDVVIYLEGFSDVSDIQWDEPPQGLVL